MVPAGIFIQTLNEMIDERLHQKRLTANHRYGSQHRGL